MANWMIVHVRSGERVLVKGGTRVDAFAVALALFPLETVTLRQYRGDLEAFEPALVIALPDVLAVEVEA